MKNIETRPYADPLSTGGDSPLIKFSKILPFILIGITCFCVYYLLNKNTQPFGDDLFLKFVYQGWNVDEITASRVTNISEIFEGMILYYKTFRGRVIAEGLCQLFAVFGKQYFNILNSFVFVGITSLVYFHSNYGKKASWRLYLIVCVVFWFLTPSLAMTSLWMASSLCQFWPVFFILLFLAPYRTLFSKIVEVKHPVILSLFLIPIGFIAGAFNEQSFGLSIGFAVLAIIFVILKRRIVPMWAIIGLLSTICGTMFVLLAPGNSFQYGSPLRLYLNTFPDNVFRAVVVSFEVTIVLLLVTLIVFVWLCVDIRMKSKLSSKEKENGEQIEHRFSMRSFIHNNEILIRCLFLIIGSIVIVNALPYVVNSLITPGFVSFAKVLLYVYLVVLCIRQIEPIRKEIKLMSRRKKTGKQAERKCSLKLIADDRNGVLVPSMFLITTIGSVVIATALPYFDHRLFFTVFVSFALVFFSLLSEAIDRIENSEGKLKSLFTNKYLRIAVPIFISLLSIIDFGSQFRVYHREFVVYNTYFVDYIEEQVASGERNVFYPQKSEIRERFYKGGRLHNFIFYWSNGELDSIPLINKWNAYYFGVDTLSDSE